MINAAQALTKAGLAEKSIAVRVQKIDAETVCCVVEDSGPGIDADHLPHLFDGFFTTKETGMGLGLQITQSIIEAHGGHIGADNSSTLGGARFAFSLPIAAGDMPSPIERGAIRSSAAGSQHRGRSGAASALLPTVRMEAVLIVPGRRSGYSDREKIHCDFNPDLATGLSE
ncbi:Sensor protein FixL [Bradyrhizobium ivorense]|uniref:histidine kinase n=1 Tax=Bradyrhizobium ivorense TaxID=2511166 RepID=A0A508T3W6_9BRAD|nr:Sensor protein FixL [Bradyrhizobium ivorense]